MTQSFGNIFTADMKPWPKSPTFHTKVKKFGSVGYIYKRSFKYIATYPTRGNNAEPVITYLIKSCLSCHCFTLACFWYCCFHVTNNLAMVLLFLTATMWLAITVLCLCPEIINSNIKFSTFTCRKKPITLWLIVQSGYHLTPDLPPPR